MKIQRLQLLNVKGFEGITIDFKPTINNSDLLVILGENGSGKSTILKSIVNNLTALCPIYKGHFFDQHDVYLDQEELSIDARYIFNENELQQLFPEEFIFNPSLRELEFRVSISGIRDSHKIAMWASDSKAADRIIKIRKSFVSSKFTGGNIFYFDPYRFLPNEELEGPNAINLPENAREGALTSSVLDNENLNKRFLFIKQWLINLDFKKLKNPSIENNLIFEKVTKAFDDLFDPYVFERVSEQGEILFKFNNKLIEIDRLSEGFKNIFIIVGEILFRLSISFPNKIDFFNEESLILIDEIDCHLHPKWQVKIIPFLQKMLPNSQIIVTTHSPFITTHINEDNILRLGEIKYE